MYMYMYIHAVASKGDGEQAKVQSLAELFRPPFDIMFTGTFQEVYMYVLYCTCAMYVQYMYMYVCVH